MTVSDSKGDVLSYPKVITSLPFTDEDDSMRYRSDYAMTCGTNASPASSKASPLPPTVWQMHAGRPLPSVVQPVLKRKRQLIWKILLR